MIFLTQMSRYPNSNPKMKTQGQVSLRTGMVVVVLLLGLAYFQPIAADAGDGKLNVTANLFPNPFPSQTCSP